VGGETAVSGVTTAVFGNKVWGNGRPIVSRQCRTATLSALQIMNGETAVSGVATAVFGNKVWGNGRPIVSRQVGVGWGKEEVGRITAVINYKRGRRGGTPAAAQ
jgi:hypothetical protein